MEEIFRGAPGSVDVMSEDLLILKDVYKEYVSSNVVTKALNGIDLVVKRGEIISIMGPSGSGKTTLLNIAGLLDKPTFGEVLFKGFRISELSDNEIAKLRNRGIGFVFQFFNLINRLTVYENIEMPLIPRMIPKEKRYEMVLKALKLASGDISWLYKKPNQLSGGQQQRVAIARAIVGEPDLLLADEPTGNLDRASAKNIMETFLNLNKYGMTIVIVTHDPEIANCTNKIYEIRDGKIINIRETSKQECIINKL